MVGERVNPIDQQGLRSAGNTPDVSVVIVTEGMSVEELVEIVDGNSSRDSANGVSSHPNVHPERFEKENIAPSLFVVPVDLRQ